MTKRRNMPYVWVIEWNLLGKWMPFAGPSCIDIRTARHVLKGWRAQCPDHKFKVVKYFRLAQGKPEVQK